MTPEMIPALTALIRTAGAEVLRLYHAGAPVRRKTDGSPVTSADEASEAILLDGLRQIAPDIPVLSEEQVAAGQIPSLSGVRGYWCVDPVDGTKEFINRTGEFALCIGYVEGDRAVGGLVHAPVTDRCFAGLSGWGAIEQAADGTSRDLTGRKPRTGLALVSRSHHDGGVLNNLLVSEGISRQQGMGSALKFGLLAAGEADLTARTGPTCEWDTAAGQAILEASGGSLTTLDGSPLRYGKEKFLNPGFIARANLMN